MTQLFGVGESECAVIFVWAYALASAAVTAWSAFFLWTLSPEKRGVRNENAGGRAAELAAGSRAFRAVSLAPSPTGSAVRRMSSHTAAPVFSVVA
nr:unnamed protein product [Digitaria exilis]